MPPVSRVLEVLLRLSGQQEYQQGLAAADAATDEFASGAEEASASIADQFESIAAALLPVSAAISGLGAAAVAVALPYDRAFTQIETLVGVAADEVDRMRVATLDLAGDTARAPAELAEAMFTIQSAGLRGAAGTEALEVAAR